MGVLVKIVTMTLAGRGSETIIADALRSTREWADAHLILDSCGDCRLAEPIDALDGAGVLDMPYEWPGDFGRARNDAIDAAAAFAEGEDWWAVTLDTDERIHGDMRAAIEHAEREGFACVSVFSADGTYTKPRAFRLPCVARWVGRTHEAIAIPSYVAEGVTFSELPKTREQLAAKFKRDLAVLEETLATDLTNARAWYYAGDACEGLGMLDRAWHCFATCAMFSTWDEEKAWSRYREAVVATRLDNYEAAKNACALGMVTRPDFPEFPWLIAWCELEQARKAIGDARIAHARRAVEWGEIAVHRTQDGRAMHGLPERIGFRHAPAHFEGPDDVLAHAYAMLGLPELADYHRKRWAQCYRLRTTGAK
jgi:hypothetical protein